MTTASSRSRRGGSGIEVNEDKVRQMAAEGHRWRNPVWRMPTAALRSGDHADRPETEPRLDLCRRRGRFLRALSGASVTLPHNAVDLPLSYFDETCYQRAFTYQRVIAWDGTQWAGCRVQLRFDGAMADNVVWVNGVQVVAHPDGYTPFVAV